MNKKKCGIALLFLGIILIVAGVIVEVISNQMPNIIKSMQKSGLPIVKTSETFGTWSNPGKLPVTMVFRFFDIKNNLDTKASNASDDTPLEEGGKPIVEEKGPYVYRETRIRSNINYNTDETELEFQEKTEYVFDADASNGTENDMVYGLNIPLLTAYGISSFLDPNFAPTAKFMLQNWARTAKPKVVVQKTVREWLWGSEYPILNLVKTIPDAVLGPAAAAKMDTFGYMMDNNATNTFVIGTGLEDLQDLAQIKKFNGETELNHWGSNYSNMIKGTDATIFHPNIDPLEELYIFAPDLCRSIYAKATGEKTIKGIKTLVFSPPSDVFAEAKFNPQNEGFCEPKPCLGSGLLRVTNCRHFAPIVISQPHLCDVDAHVQTKVSGVSPDPTKHKTEIFVEPNLGIVIEVRKRIEFNALILPEPGMEETKMMTKGQIVPIFWVEEGFLATDELAELVRTNVNAIETARSFPNTGFKILCATAAIGIFLIIVAFVTTSRSKDSSGGMSMVPPMRMTSLAKNSENGGYKNNGYSRDNDYS